MPDVVTRLRTHVVPLLRPERRIDIVGGLTLVVLLLTTQKTWGLQVALVPLVAAAVVDRRLVRAAAYWLAVLAVYAVGVAPSVLEIDNHEWLLGYWLLALALSRLLDEPAAGLATSARLLVGAAFAFAVLWKATTPEYLSGDAFHGFVVLDPRFAGLAAAASDLTLDDGDRARLVARALQVVGDADLGVALPDAPGVGRLAAVMTWWTLGIEAVVGACCLAPPRSALGRARHAALLAFLFTTYLLAPVLGFGWLLVAMGLAQAPLDRRPALGAAYAGAFVLVLARATMPLPWVLSFF